MFRFETKQRPRSGAMGMLELIYHSVVRSIRKGHGNAVMSLVINMLQTLTFVAAFYILFTVLGMRGAALRGDFLLYIMTGVFVFMTHTKTVSAVISSEGPSSPMMKHAPMNTIIAISASALGSLYIQILSLFAILFVYHVGFTPVEIDYYPGAVAMFFLAWATGVGVGMVFLGMRPFFPSFVSIGSQIYNRANMIASGKMFVANSLPSFMIAFFDWNPLFHIIDQMRGYVFINYNPHFTNYEYPMIAGVVLILIGLMGEFYARKNASLSREASR